MLTCPVCRAANADPPACRRCKADLALLWAVERRRGWHLAAGRAAAAQGDFAAAFRHGRAAHALRGDDQSRGLAAAARLLGGDPAGAWAVAGGGP